MLVTAGRWAARFGLSLILAIAAVGACSAADGSDRDAVQSVIAKQLEAFKHDDATAAFGFAAPGIKTKFPDAAAFMAMVKRSYAPVYRPKSVAFGEFNTTDSGFSQSMSIIDSDGQAWTALYSLERGPDGQLRINGCALVKSPEIST